MKISKFLAVTALATLVSLANAESFNFTYDIKGHAVTGSFDGIRTGALNTNYTVTELSNVTVKVDGSEFFGNGNLTVGHTGLNNVFVIGGAVASRDGNANDFMFVGYKNGQWQNIFYSNAIHTSGNTGYKYHVPDVSVGERTVATHWTLSPVPEPETYAMLLAGLGVMGAVARRRKAKQA
jgi:hypothetical protein